MTAKRVLSGFLRIVTILLILLLLLGSGLLFASSLTGKDGIFGYQLYLPADTATDFKNTAVVVQVEEEYRLGDVVLFPTVDGIKTAEITAEGEICNLAIGDTGEFYAATTEEILGRALFYSYPIGVAFAFLYEHWIAAAAGAFLLFCILLALLILLSRGKKQKEKEDAPVEKTPKIVEEQNAYEETEKAPLDETARAEQVSEFVLPEEDKTVIETENSPSKEEVEQMLEQETKEIVFEKPVPPTEPPIVPAEEEEPKEEIPLQDEAEADVELPPSEVTETEVPIKSEEKEPIAEEISSVRSHFAELEKELEAFKASLLNDDK